MRSSFELLINAAQEIPQASEATAIVLDWPPKEESKSPLLKTTSTSEIGPGGHRPDSLRTKLS